MGEGLSIKTYTAGQKVCPDCGRVLRVLFTSYYCAWCADGNLSTYSDDLWCESTKPYTWEDLLDNEVKP